tara:strand:+ start:5649 stop:5867 length:219 start_codon:yes stop_codon:yes gene_type:complete
MIDITVSKSGTYIELAIHWTPIERDGRGLGVLRAGAIQNIIILTEGAAERLYNAIGDILWTEQDGHRGARST